MVRWWGVLLLKIYPSHTSFALLPPSLPASLPPSPLPFCFFLHHSYCWLLLGAIAIGSGQAEGLKEMLIEATGGGLCILVEAEAAQREHVVPDIR